MKSFGDNAFAITTEPMPVGKTLYYYCEARTDDEYLTTAFYPQYAEGKPDELLLIPQRKKNPSLVINEIMAANASYKMNSKGEYADWIEIKNTSNGEVDLSGMYLTDDKEDLRKWAFPEGTTVAEGDYLIVWADGTKNSSDKFASFKLSKSGETIWLIGTNGNGNPIVDALKFGKQIDGRSYGQTKNGEFKIQTPTLGSDNEK